MLVPRRLLLESQNRHLSRRATWVCLLAVTTVAAGFAGYQQSFSSFACYDDEGYVMVSLRAYLSGQPLYDEVFSQYGPFYYHVNGLFHRLASLPVTHDVARLKTLAIWLSVAVMGAAIVGRITRNAWLTMFALLACFFHLDRLGLEAGHPQEICVWLLVASLLTATYVNIDRIRGSTSAKMFSWQSIHAALPFMLLGLFTGLLSMTKINAGGLLGISLTTALLLATAPSRLRSVLLSGCLFAVFLVPILLMRDQLISSLGFRLPWVVVSGAGLIGYIALKQPNTARFPLRCLLSYWVSFLITFFIVGGLACVQGTSLLGLADGLVLHHLGFGEACFKSAPVFTLAIPAVAFAAWLAVKCLQQSPVAERCVRMAMVVVIIGAGVRYLMDTFIPIMHGAEDRGLAALLLSYFTPLLWIILLPGDDRHAVSSEAALAARNSSFARLALCLVAVLQPLIAFPIPGTQVAIGTLGLLLAAIVGLSDTVQIPNMLGANDGRLRRGMAPVCCLLVLITVGCRDVHHWRYRASCVSLDLPGAQQLRLPAREVARHRWVVEQLRAHADTFVGVPNGYNSYYLWAELPTPNSLMTTDWPNLLYAKEQEAIVAALPKFDRVCIVFDDFLRGPAPENSPLARHVLERFEPFTTFDHLQIWRRREVAAVSAQGKHRTDQLVRIDD